MKGRKPDPTPLKLVRGETRPSRVNRSEPKFQPAESDPPPYVTGKAREKWLEVVPQLEAARVLKRVNLTTLARYCLDWERYCDAIQDIEANGEFYKTEGGLMKRNPAGAAATELSRLLLALEAEFGMTPSSSTRIKAADGEDDAMDAEFLGAGA